MSEIRIFRSATPRSSVGKIVIYGIASAVSLDVSEFFRSEEEARAVLERRE
jgi:hypothetical protein